MSRALSRSAFLVALLLTALPAIRAEAQEITFEERDFDKTLEAAQESFQGELLLYYDRPGSQLSSAIERILLKDASIRSYIENNFARHAVDIRSESSKSLQQTYGIMGGETNPDLKPTIALISHRKHDVYLKYWDRPEEIDPAGFLTWLKQIKERP